MRLKVQPAGEILDADPVLDCRLAYPENEARRALPEIFAPGIFAEDTQGLGDGFVQRLGTNLNRMLDAARISAGDSASADGHARKLSCSSFVRYKGRRYA